MFEQKPQKNAAGIDIYKPEDFEGMRKAGKLAAETLDMITEYVQPGITTDELDQKCYDFIVKNGAIPAPLYYLGNNKWDESGKNGYQKTTCISINHVVCHGIPGERKLVDGDILNIDVTVIVDGWFGDTSRMFVAGDKVSVKAQKLMDITYECLMRSIEIVKPGTTLGDIGHVIQELAESNRFSVVRDFCGHGLGRYFHAPPSVVHYGRPGEGAVLEAGMFLTIEPMINAGGWATKTLPDGWTAVTRDRSLSAQFEHSLAVTDDGFEIFTLSPKGYTKPPYSS